MERRGPGTMGAMDTVTPSSAPSLSHQLERDRIEQRATRVRQVLHALRERAGAREGTAGDRAVGAPAPLRAAIEDFGRELAELERRLQHHRRYDGAGHP
jgi:hypothetical protein